MPSLNRCICNSGLFFFLYTRWETELLALHALYSAIYVYNDVPETNLAFYNLHTIIKGKHRQYLPNTGRSLSVVIVQSRSHARLFVTLWTAEHRAHLSSTVSRSLLKFMSIGQWCYLAISSSVAPFSFCPQSFPASGSFPVRQFFTSGGQSIRASASASVLPVNIQGWFPLGLTGCTFQKLMAFGGKSKSHKKNKNLPHEAMS